MTLGLQNVPSTLCYHVISGLKGCAVYLDDVVVYSNTWELHLQYIEALFVEFERGSANIILAKCEFTKATVINLGTVVGQGEMRPVQAKVRAIGGFPTPTTMKLVCFLGMLGYYRNFCSSFSTVVPPLIDLLKAKTKVCLVVHISTSF